jgi:hypothetical protein
MREMDLQGHSRVNRIEKARQFDVVATQMSGAVDCGPQFALSGGSKASQGPCIRSDFRRFGFDAQGVTT